MLKIKDYDELNYLSTKELKTIIIELDKEVNRELTIIEELEYRLKKLGIKVINTTEEVYLDSPLNQEITYVEMVEIPEIRYFKGWN